MTQEYLNEPHKFSYSMDTCLFPIFYQASSKVSHGATKTEDYQTHQSGSKSNGQAQGNKHFSDLSTDMN